MNRVGYSVNNIECGQSVHNIKIVHSTPKREAGHGELPSLVTGSEKEREISGLTANFVYLANLWLVA